MTQVRDKAKETIRDYLAHQFIMGRLYHRTATHENVEAIERDMERILSIPELAIVDREAELPKCDVEYNPLACGAEDDTDNCYRSGWDEAQEAMLKAGWIKEVK